MRRVCMCACHVGRAGRRAALGGKCSCYSRGGSSRTPSPVLTDTTWRGTSNGCPTWSFKFSNSTFKKVQKIGKILMIYFIQSNITKILFQHVTIRKKRGFFGYFWHYVTHSTSYFQLSTFQAPWTTGCPSGDSTAAAGDRTRARMRRLHKRERKPARPRQSPTPRPAAGKGARDRSSHRPSVRRGWRGAKARTEANWGKGEN